ncbi:MAG: DegQ family serine endoprotease [Pseudomonadota bacterium]
MTVTPRTKKIAAAVALALGVGAAATAYQPDAAALATPAATEAAPLLALPDFSRLVQRHGDAVVNITTEGKARGPRAALPDFGDDLPEFFKRFPFPDMPREGGEMPRARGIGSGFIISGDGYVVTSHHVIDGAEKVTVRLNDKREFTARVVGSDPQSDVALLKIDATGLPAVQIGKSADLKVGQWVFAIGAPFGLDRTATQGIVSAVGRQLPSDNYVPFIQTDVAVNPGNSGGPLFDTAGRVVGINSQIFSRSGGYMGLSFAIPIDVAMDVVEQLKTSGEVTRGWLGITLQEVTQDLARSFGLERPRGALVARVGSGSPAEKAGLKAGDVIVKYGERDIVDTGDLPPLVGATRPGEKRILTVIRGGDEKRLVVELGRLAAREKVQLGQLPGEAGGAVLNVVVAELTPEQRRSRGIDHGVLVQQVGPGIALEAGVRPGDVLLELNGRKVESVAQLKELTRSLPKGRTVPLLVKRGEGALFLALDVPAASKG